MFMNIGGSAQGGRGVWNLTIDEGIPDDILDRGWCVTTAKQDDGTAEGELGVKAIMDVLELLGEGRGVNINDIRFMLNNPIQEALGNKLRDMVKNGDISMLPGNNFELREKF
jgi:hypothetical protein